MTVAGDGDATKAASLLSIVITASPSPSNPSTFLIEKCLESIFACIPCLTTAVPIIVLLDGYVVRTKAQTKKGIISPDMVGPYEQYYDELKAMCGRKGLENCRIERLPSHHGFALAVQHGLQLSTTQYCLVCQYDRVFRQIFTHLLEVIEAMENNPHIRYVGFPTVTSSTHRSQLATRYSLPYLNGQDMCVDLGKGYSLQPCIFWFDSQHLCHRDRYLQIYQPFTHMSEDLKDMLGRRFLKDMVLRRGDFIEDRFGQMQRRCFIEMRTRGADPDFIKRAFRWFGSFLVWIPSKGNGREMGMMSAAAYSVDLACSDVSAINLHVPGASCGDGDVDSWVGGSSSSGTISSLNVQDVGMPGGSEDRNQISGNEPDASACVGGLAGVSVQRFEADADAVDSGAMARSGAQHAARVFVSHLRGRHWESEKKAMHMEANRAKLAELDQQ